MRTHNVIFIDQLANANPTSIDKEYGEIRDTEAATRFGVRLLKEFSYWAWRACAIANIAMILATENRLKETLYELICEALQMNGYAYANRHGAVDIGWKHSTLCKILRKRGLNAQRLKRLSLAKITQLLKEGRYVVLSVKSKTGGHMVLITSIDKEHIVYNDPLRFQNRGGENTQETLTTFEEKFLGKGLTAW